MAFKSYNEESDSELELVSNPMSRPILLVLNVESLRRYVIGLFAPMVKGGKNDWQVYGRNSVLCSHPSIARFAACLISPVFIVHLQ